MSDIDAAREHAEFLVRKGCDVPPEQVEVLLAEIDRLTMHEEKGGGMTRYSFDHVEGLAEDPTGGWCKHEDAADEINRLKVEMQERSTFDDDVEWWLKVRSEMQKEIDRLNTRVTDLTAQAVVHIEERDKLKAELAKARSDVVSWQRAVHASQETERARCAEVIEANVANPKLLRHLLDAIKGET